VPATDVLSCEAGAGCSLSCYLSEPFQIGAISMPREVISTAEAPEYPTYSQAVKVGNTIYVAGTTGVDVTTGELAGSTVQEQARQSLRNCQAILRAGGAKLSDAVMVHTLLLRPEDADGLIEVFDEFFPDVRPPRFVAKLGVDRPGLLISIAMVAVID
jgi:2-iminobutanoate/2-iminopropanoate deaminase